MNSTEILKELETGKHILKVWAGWCMPCKAYAPDFEAATADIKDDIKVGDIDVDAHVEVAQKFGIRGIPSTIFINNGKVEVVAGKKSVEEVKSLITQFLA